MQIFSKKEILKCLYQANVAKILEISLMLINSKMNKLIIEYKAM